MLKAKRGVRRAAVALIVLLLGCTAGVNADTSGTGLQDTACWSVYSILPILGQPFGSFSSADAALNAGYLSEAGAIQQAVTRVKAGYPNSVLEAGMDQIEGPDDVARGYYMMDPKYGLITAVAYFDAELTSYCQSQYAVKLSNVSGSNSAPPVTPDPPTYTPLAVLGPSNTLDGSLVTNAKLIAKVYDQSGQVVPNINVQLTLKPIAGSGGHVHDTGDDNRPAGALDGYPSTIANPEPLTRSTGSDGEEFTFTYTAPEPSGDYQIVAKCTNGVTCTQQGPDTVWVGVQNLEPLSPNPPDNIYHLVGQDAAHPDNHYLTERATEAVTILAALYHGEFPNEPAEGLALNDGSLERGGLFDIYYDYKDKHGVVHKRTSYWTTPHKEHRLGIVIDVRANGSATAIPAQNFTRFEFIVDHVLHGNWYPENLNLSNGHFHVRLIGEQG